MSSAPESTAERLFLQMAAEFERRKFAAGMLISLVDLVLETRKYPPPAATLTELFERFPRSVQTASGGYVPKATYPDSRLATDLKFAAQVVTAGVGVRVIYVTTGGYDTHSNQPGDQAKLHQQFAEALAAFQADVEGQGLADDVALLAWSEFGRRVEENGSNGTDHGTAGPMFLMGAKVAGGLHGQDPSLTQLDDNDDLIFTVDFREVYADVLENWLGVDSKDVLLGTFSPLGLFAS